MAGLNDVVPCTICFICYLFLQKVGIREIIFISDCHSYKTVGEIYQFVSSGVLILKWRYNMFLFKTSVQKIIEHTLPHKRCSKKKTSILSK